MCTTKIALVDDDAAQMAHLKTLFTKEMAFFGAGDCSVEEFHTGEEFLSVWKPDSFDLIVLDIYMGSLSGIDVARRIRQADEHVRLAFCSSSNEFAAESYEVNAQYYLQKPVTEAGIANMLRRLNLELIELTRTVRLPDGHPVILRKILYTNYANHVVTLYLKDDVPYRLRTSHAEIEALLMSHGYFFSPIKGMIVNFYEIVKLIDDTILISNGQTLPVTRRKIKEVKEAYTKFRFNKMRKEVGN